MFRLTTLRGLQLFLLCAVASCFAAAQTPATMRPTVSTAASAGVKPTPPAAAELEEVRRQLREQQEALERLSAIITRQSQVIESLRQRVEQTAPQPTGSARPPGELTATDALPAAASSGVTVTNRTTQADERLSRAEQQIKQNAEAIARQLGNISFSGDLRLRYESFFGQSNALANADNPAIVGNELSPRHRFRVRARLNIRGQIGKEFDWGLRLGTNSFADAVSPNQTLTDFYNRKPFGLENMYIAWTPRRIPGLRVQGGKFEVPWLRTEMTLDNDLNPEGFSQTYSRPFKHSVLKNISFTAWQLPFLERNSAFIRNANGTVNVDETRRAGRDLALYGAQLLTRFEPAPEVALTFSVADLYFSGTQFITPVQVFGNQLQLPLTIVIPATATTPAQTVTAQVSIPRELLVAGAGNLGVSAATNNATNRDGRLSSGYNLLDFIGRIDLTRSKRFPVALIFNFVTNTQTHDVVAARAGGGNNFLSNHENNGYWAEVQVGRLRERGNVAFGYTFIRIEKDAVLTPFNFSDLAQQSDIRAHRWSLSYAADARVLLTFTGIASKRPNGLLGVFGATPPGSLNEPTIRLQFDTTFRF